VHVHAPTYASLHDRFEAAGGREARRAAAHRQARQQWINSIEQHVPAALLDTSIDRINAVDLLDELVPILRKVPETGSRIYQRLATIFNAAVIDGLRPDNPATGRAGHSARPSQ